MDFKNNKETDDYLKMVEDNDWEHITTVTSGLMYFRKKVKDCTKEKDYEIFSDNETKLEMAKDILKKRLIPFGLIILLFNVPLFISSLSYKFATYYTLYSDILLFILYFYIMIHSLLRMRRMKRNGFIVEENRTKYVKITVLILAILFVLPMPNISINRSLVNHGINGVKIEEIDRAIVYDNTSKENYIISDNYDLSELMDIVFSDNLKRDGKYRARDSIENKMLYDIFLLDSSNEYTEKAMILSNDIIVYNMNKYVFNDDKPIDIDKLNDIMLDGKHLIKYLKHNDSLYHKTDETTDGRIDDLDVFFVKTIVGLQEDVINNEEANFNCGTYQIIDENTLNVQLDGKWFIFEKEE